MKFDKIDVKQTFSERMGLKQFRNIVQLDGIDEPLKISLWNVFYELYDFGYGPMEISSLPPMEEDFCKHLWHDFFVLPLSSLPHRYSEVFSVIKNKFNGFKWYEIYDFLEFVARYDLDGKNKKLIRGCNIILERNNSGYRFVGNDMTPLIQEDEIQEIEKVLENTERLSLKGAKAHIQSAIDKISDKRNPDYRNSIKESISAVESICRMILGDSNITLGNALNKLGGYIKIHPALKDGFNKLYGYTSDGEGIRHSMQDEPDLDFEDAQYMLVSCSAFVNYLITKSQKAGIFE